MANTPQRPASGSATPGSDAPKPDAPKDLTAGDTALATRQPEGASTAGSLSVDEVTDTRDNVDVEPTKKTSGKRLRAIPTSGGIEIKVSSLDFDILGVKDHHDVTFYKQQSREHPRIAPGFILEVGEGPDRISKDAADALIRVEPLRFEYMTEAPEEADAPDDE